MDTIKSALSKLDHPPAAQNWVRYNHPDPIKTGKAIAEFSLGVPNISFQSGMKVVKDRIELGVNLETAIKAVRRTGNPKGRKPNEDFVRAFFRHDEERKYSGCKSFDGFRGGFRISRGISVPVTPTSVILENGSLLPLFVCGWTTIPLTVFQRRLLMSLYEDAVFSLTDFQESSAEMVFFPKDKAFNGGERHPEVWKRGDYPILTDSELKEQIDVFLEGREIAKQIIVEKLSKLQKSKEDETEKSDQTIDPDQGSLF